MGIWGFLGALIALVLAWAYSMPPIRLKTNGWYGNAACGVSYEGIAWVTGAAVMAGGSFPEEKSVILALLYSIGAHGIMTLNDFNRHVRHSKLAANGDSTPRNPQKKETRDKMRSYFQHHCWG